MNYLVIELATTEAVFSRFQTRKGALVFTGGGRQPLETADSLPQLLAQAKANGGAQHKVILCIPSSELYLREIDLPLTDRRKIRSILPLEMKGETAMDADDLVFDGIPFPDGKVLAVWAKRRDLAEHIRILKESGLEPEVVTASPFHWGALVATMTGVCAVSDGRCIAVYREGQTIFVRPLRSADEAEVNRTLAAVEMGKGVTVETLFVHGAAKEWVGTTATDIPRAPIPVAGELTAAFPEDGRAAVDLAGAYAVARACMAGNEVNFRTGDLAYTAGRDRMRRRLRLTAILAAAGVLLLFAEAGVRYALVRQDLNSLNRSIGGMYREVFPTRKKPVDEVAELRSEIKRLGGGITSGSTLIALKKLAEAKGDDVTGLYEVEVEGSQVRVKGDARSVQAVNDFKSRAAAAFTGAEVGEMKTRPDGSVSFTFQGTLKGETR